MDTPALLAVSLAALILFDQSTVQLFDSLVLYLTLWQVSQYILSMDRSSVTTCLLEFWDLGLAAYDSDTLEDHSRTAPRCSQHSRSLETIL